MFLRNRQKAFYVFKGRREVRFSHVPLARIISYKFEPKIEKSSVSMLLIVLVVLGRLQATMPSKCVKIPRNFQPVPLKIPVGPESMV